MRRRRPPLRVHGPMDGVGLIAEALPPPAERPFWLLGLDTTPAVRPFAEKLVDRGVVYYPNPAPGNKPIGVGHRYSVLALLPERGPREAPWVVPLRCQRVPTAKKAREVAAAHLRPIPPSPAAVQPSRRAPSPPWPPSAAGYPPHRAGCYTVG